MKLRIEKTKAQILAFVTQGIQAAMNQYNGT
jgi:hypothetical protein